MNNFFSAMQCNGFLYIIAQRHTIKGCDKATETTFKAAFVLFMTVAAQQISQQAPFRFSRV
jgi:hypothetical protein